MSADVLPYPDKPLTVPEVIERWPTLRQSLLADFDDCALYAYFGMRYTQGWSTHPQARGTIFHRAAAEMLRTMQAQDSGQIPVGIALAILEETLEQRGIPWKDRVRLPLREIPVLRMAVAKFAKDNRFTIRNIIDVEKRLEAPMPYVEEGTGELIERRLTGMPDAIVLDKKYPKDGVVVLDWKAQPLDARVLTPRGWVRMGEVVAGQQVVGADGQPTTVVGVFPQGSKEVFEVEFTDGSKTECCDDHLWTVRRTPMHPYVVRPLSEIRKDGSLKSGKGYLQVPNVAPVQFAGDLESGPLDPYLLGALLGDGHLPTASSATFTTVDPELLEEVERHLPAGMAVSPIDGKSWRLVAQNRKEPNPLLKALREMGLLGKTAPGKYIPPEYLLGAAPARRHALLQGLMDTDGFISERNQVSFCSASQTLAEQVQFLVRSLGGRATLKQWPREDPHHDSHAVYFRLPVCPFRLRRKADRWRPSKLTMARGIRKITSVGEKESQCIRVAAGDGLYVTDDLIVTHNTTWALPPEREASDRDAAENGLSYEGYFQQRFYAWLILKNYPSINRVTLREFYVYRSKPREATITRDALEQVEKELSNLTREFDLAVGYGKPKKLSYPAIQKTPWEPSPGKHCFAGETRFLTSRGVRTLRDACGEKVRVLNRFGHWEDAEIRSFGWQPLLRVQFDDGSVIRATPDHLWYPAVGTKHDGYNQQGDQRVTTVELERAPLTRHAIEPVVSEEGIRHGFVYGDGWRRNDRGTCEARFMPKDEEVVAYFRGAPTAGGRRRQGDGVHRRADGYLYVSALPGHYKDLPADPSPGYARGFIAGLLAADGTVCSTNGGVQIFCEGAEKAERVAELARLGGCAVSSVLCASSAPTDFSPVGTISRSLMAIRLKPATAPVITERQRRHLRATNQMRRMYVVVASIEADETEEVFCVVAPRSESFTLANGVATSNCYYCPLRHHCPIADEVLNTIAIQSPEQAKRAVAIMEVAEATAKQAKQAARPFAEIHGPIPSRHSKGRRVWGPKTNKSGKPEFRFFVPEGADRAPARNPETDKPLEDALRRAAEEQRGDDDSERVAA